MLTDIKWVYVSENALYVNGVSTVFLRNIQLD